ncbi:hypothetical protein G2W53_023050 [Senna tora]|uniref:Uncharacterized protein n=1 Tax=Senna tora TaxID=362788 RepID=A0A834TPS9_9FABA|nr:hypothetical protein G2W53_023050 [Senna tora]
MAIHPSLIQCIRASTVIQHMAPNPLNQVPPSDPIHVIRGTISCVQHLPRLSHLVPYHADHPVHSDVVVWRLERLPVRDKSRYGERVRALTRTELGRVSDPRVRERVPDEGREGEVVESTDGGAEILDAREGFPVGVEPVVLLLAEPDGFRDVGPGLVGVELDGSPPAGDGGAPGVGGGDRVDELADDLLLAPLPSAVPDCVDGDVGGEDWSHVVLELHELRRALEFLGVAVGVVGNVDSVVGDGGGMWRPGPPSGDGRGGKEEEKGEGEKECGGENRRGRWCRRGGGGMAHFGVWGDWECGCGE